MNDKLSMMIMEGPDGKIAIELFEDGPKALEAFSNLVGQPGDKPSRATFILLDQVEGQVVHYEKKDLPMPRGDEPWGHRLGEGPIEKPEESSEEGGNT